MSMDQRRSKRPGSGGPKKDLPPPRRNQSTALAAEDEDTAAKRRYTEIDERRLKEWSDFQKRERSQEGTNRKVFVDFTISDSPAGRIVIELFDDVVPGVCENFCQLFQGSRGFDSATGLKLDYVDTHCYRIVRGAGLFFGRIGGLSLPAAGEPVKDENFAKRHVERGLLSAVSMGPDTIGSTFLITSDKAAALDFVQVVFGRIVEGLTVLDKLEAVKTNKFGEPQQPIVISFSGALNGKRPLLASTDEKGEPEILDE